MRAATRPLPLAAALLIVATHAPAHADWVEISQSYFTKPLKTVHFIRPTKETTSQNQPYGVTRGNSNLYEDRNLSTGSKRVNPFLTRPSVNKKPNRVEIRRPPVINAVNKDNIVSDKPPALSEEKKEVKGKINKTTNKVVHLDHHKAHSVVEPVRKPTTSSKEIDNYRKADVPASSEDYSSSTSSEERIRVKFKGVVEPVAKPEKILLEPKKNVKEIDKKATTTKATPAKDSDEQNGDRIGDVKLVFQTPKPLEKKAPHVAQVNKIHRNRIYVNTLSHSNSVGEKDNISTSTESQIYDKLDSNAESGQIKVEGTSASMEKEPSAKPEIVHVQFVDRRKIEYSSEVSITADPTTTQKNEESSVEMSKNNFKRLVVNSLNNFKDPEFVTKDETFEIEDDDKFADVIVDVEPNESQEPFVGEAHEDSTKESLTTTEETVSSDIKDSNENVKVPESNASLSNETKPNPMENVVKLMKAVADTINQNTRKSFKSKINYLERLRDDIMSNIKDRIDAAWPDDEVPGARRARTARGHIEFPSSESALMTISFLTFAVFLIKLVLQVISTYKNKIMVPPAVFAVSRAAAAAAAAAASLRGRDDHK